MGLHKRVQAKKEPKEEQSEEEEPNKESFNPVELEQAFHSAYRSYRI